MAAARPSNAGRADGEDGENGVPEIVEGLVCMPNQKSRTPTGAVIVAHPDDETLWCGGFMLERPDWAWFVFTLCRGDDPDRAPRFARVLRQLGADGAMATLDDGPEQDPLDLGLIGRTILEHLPSTRYDLVLTHGPEGEYTRHRRHEECSAAVLALWASGRIETREMRQFAYEDQGGTSLPHVHRDADERTTLGPSTFARKYAMITDLYGFQAQSWEAKATPRTEGFYRLASPSVRISPVQRPIPTSYDS